VKKSFALLSTILIIVIFSYLSINIIQNKAYNNQINKLKYLEIQAQIHMNKIIKEITTSPIINDSKFVLEIYDDNISYHIYLKSNDELNTHISLYQKVLK
jgi:hypothetical protein